MEREILVARAKPVAPDTWEVREVLPAANEETRRIPIEFPEPSIIVGARATVIQVTAAGDRLVPDTDAILVQMDLDNQRQFTSADRVGQTTAAGRGSQFVTLSALDTRFRDLYICCDSPRPVVGVVFRWKNYDPALYEDALISLAFFVIPKNPR